MESFLVLLCAIIIAIVFYKKVAISNKFIKIVASFGIWLISSMFLVSIFCKDTLDAQDRQEKYYVERLQVFADSLNTFYHGNAIDINGNKLECLDTDNKWLDSLSFYYNNINETHKYEFFETNTSYYQVNKILHADKDYINKHTDNLLYAAKNIIKDNMKNPDSFDFVGYNIKYYSDNNIGHVLVSIKYRGTNSFNATVTETQDIIVM